MTTSTRWTRFAPLALLLSAFTAACAPATAENSADGLRDRGDDPRTPPEATCRENADCDAALGELCVSGHCVRRPTDCAPGQTLCHLVCVDLATDAMNCGACGNACRDGWSCSESRCVDVRVPPVATCRVDSDCDSTTRSRCIGGVCAEEPPVEPCDLADGTRGVRCADGSGVCVDLANDPMNCGACGHRCEDGFCSGGRCGAPPPPVASCRQNSDCGTGRFCRFEPGRCGGEGACHAIPSPRECASIDPTPACGCDGRTYDNWCSAAVEGVSVRNSGACSTGTGF